MPTTKDAKQTKQRYEYLGSELMARVKRIKLGSIQDELIFKKVFYLSDAEHAVAEYRKYLFLHGVYPACTRTFVASDEISAVWHTHILLTSAYREDCTMLFGGVLEHSFTPSPNTKNYTKGVEKFKSFYKMYFGPIPKCFTFTGEPITREEFRRAHRGNQ